MTKISSTIPLILILSIGIGIALKYSPPVTKKIISPIIPFILGVIS